MFTPQTTARLCVLAHHLLIWRGNERIAGTHVSLKRQEPTPKGEKLSQSQSLSPLCEDINTTFDNWRLAAEQGFMPINARAEFQDRGIEFEEALEFHPNKPPDYLERVE
jgi:hypothetical protein